MAVRSFKSHSEFFFNLASGALGARAVVEDLARYEHEMVPLEQGADDPKVWAGVKRKALRLPDLLCIRCGLRVESRTKFKASVVMSHSTQPGRAWDSGLNDDDYIAFPVAPRDEFRAFRGQFDAPNRTATFQEEVTGSWTLTPLIEYFTVEELRAIEAGERGRKDPTRGAEGSLEWIMYPSKIDGEVVDVIESEDGNKLVSVKVRSDSTGRISTYRLYKRRAGGELSGVGEVFVRRGDHVTRNQFLGGVVRPLGARQLQCTGRNLVDRIRDWLESGTVQDRVSGIRLAKLAAVPGFERRIELLAEDSDQDIYVRMEAAAYLCALDEQQHLHLFEEALKQDDPALRLEAVITLSNISGSASRELLRRVLNDAAENESVRAGAAWSLSNLDLNDTNETQKDVDLLLVTAASVEGEVGAGAVEALQTMAAASDKVRTHLIDKLFGHPGEATTACKVLAMSNLSPDELTEVAQRCTKQPSSEALRLLGWRDRVHEPEEPEWKELLSEDARRVVEALEGARSTFGASSQIS